MHLQVSELFEIHAAVSENNNNDYWKRINQYLNECTNLISSKLVPGKYPFPTRLEYEIEFMNDTKGSLATTAFAVAQRCPHAKYNRCDCIYR